MAYSKRDLYNAIIVTVFQYSPPSVALSTAAYINLSLSSCSKAPRKRIYTVSVEVSHVPWLMFLDVNKTTRLPNDVPPFLISKLLFPYRIQPTDIASLCIKICIVSKWSPIEAVFGIDISVTFMLTLVLKDFKRLNDQEESIKRYQYLVFKDSVNLCKTLVFEDSINLCKSLVYGAGHENRLVPRRTNGSSRTACVWWSIQNQLVRCIISSVAYYRNSEMEHYGLMMSAMRIHTYGRLLLSRIFW